MTQSLEGTAQRRKLLGEIERLAEIAVFGTLSETYRTCGRAGCPCQGGGPKHGPHLNISYRGEKGKTTGYYVPQAAEEATREGVAAWQKLQACLRQLAELNKERNLQRAHQVARPMKGWASLALIAGLILCLLLSLGPQAGLNSQPPVDRSGTCGSKLP